MRRARLGRFKRFLFEKAICDKRLRIIKNYGIAGITLTTSEELLLKKKEKPWTLQ
jgi:hypothetical protein